MQATDRRVPGIFLDIDGVLIQLENAIPHGIEAIKHLRTPLSQLDPERFAEHHVSLPFCCLTNSGGGSEKKKAEKVSEILRLDEKHMLKQKEVIVNFTPLRPILEEYKERLVLLVGCTDLNGIAEEIGLKKYITDEEYCVMFPFMVPYKPAKDEETIQKLRKEVAKRLEVETLDDPYQLQMNAVFILHDPDQWGERVQIICDFLSTPDGRIAHEMPLVGPAEHIPVYCTNNDLIFRGHTKLQRMTFGCFNQALLQVYKSVYKRDLELNMYGKPFGLTFKYAEGHIKNLTDMEISNFYMIGDNPKSDIRGGNAAGWRTILVQTGVFKKTETVLNDPDDPATHVVENVAEAIKLICKLEGIGGQ